METIRHFEVLIEDMTCLAMLLEMGAIVNNVRGAGYSRCPVFDVFIPKKEGMIITEFENFTLYTYSSNYGDKFHYFRFSKVNRELSYYNQLEDKE